MIWKNYVYKGLDLSVSNLRNTNIVLTNINPSTIQRSEITDNANDHGSVASNTLESWRLFTFEGYCFWMTKEARGIAWELLNSSINIEAFVDSDPFYDLTFQTDRWENRYVKAKVEKKPTQKNWLCEPRIYFVFELYAQTNAILDPAEQTSSGTTSVFWWTSFANKFWDWRRGHSGGVTCVNAWNYKAWCEITVTWTMVNPLIKNLTNWLEYKINWTTTSLVLDSRDWDWAVTDWWANIKNKREYWKPIFLSPGSNDIIVMSDSWSWTVTVKWNSARNSY